MLAELRKRTFKATSLWDSDTQHHSESKIKKRRYKDEIRLWALAKHVLQHIFKGNCGICLKRQVYNSCTFPPVIRSRGTGSSLARQRTS